MERIIKSNRLLLALTISILLACACSGGPKPSAMPDPSPPSTRISPTATPVPSTPTSIPVPTLEPVPTLSAPTAGVPTSGSSPALRVPEDCATIQAAIDAASDGDTIVVSPGTYRENIPGPETGGFFLGGWVQTQCGDPNQAN